ncbi:MAG: DNA repair protein RecO [Pseudomonadota bacterium]
MNSGDLFVTTGIAIRRVSYGDNDVIMTFFSRDQGKLTAIAKSAKKSRKRFAGVLELFSALSITCRRSRRGGMPVLQEASLQHPFANIRGDIRRTAYASYWAELVNEWLENDEEQSDIYALLYYVLSGLDEGSRDPADLSILFQIRFLAFSGMSPGIDQCHGCRKSLDSLSERPLGFNMARGSVVCSECRENGAPHIAVSHGTLKLLRWMRTGPLATAARIRCDPNARSQGLALLEAFVPYHLGKELKSLGFLREIR